MERLHQVVVRTLAQHDAVVAHPQPWLIKVELAQPRPRQLKRQRHDSVAWTDKRRQSSVPEIGTNDSPNVPRARIPVCPPHDVHTVYSRDTSIRRGA